MKTGFANPNFTPSSIAAISGSLAGTSSSSSQRTTNVASNGAVITASTHDNRTSSTYNNNEKSNTTTTISSALKSTITKKEKQRSVSSSTKALIYPSLHWCTIDMTANLLRQHHVLVTLSKDVIDDISRMTIPELYDFEFENKLVRKAEERTLEYELSRIRDEEASSKSSRTSSSSIRRTVKRAGSEEGSESASSVKSSATSSTISNILSSVSKSKKKESKKSSSIGNKKKKGALSNTIRKNGKTTLTKNPMKTAPASKSSKPSSFTGNSLPSIPDDREEGDEERESVRFVVDEERVKMSNTDARSDDESAQSRRIPCDGPAAQQIDNSMVTNSLLAPEVYPSPSSTVSNVREPMTPSISESPQQQRPSSTAIIGQPATLASLIDERRDKLKVMISITNGDRDVCEAILEQNSYDIQMAVDAYIRYQDKQRGGRYTREVAEPSRFLQSVFQCGCYDN